MANLNDDRCPYCFSKFSDALYTNDPILVPDGAKVVYDETTGLLIPEPDAEKRRYKGLSIIRNKHITELQELNDDNKPDAGWTLVEGDPESFWTPNKTHIKELRNAVEKGLGITLTTTPVERTTIMEQFLNYDDETIERQTPHQMDWTDPNLTGADWQGNISHMHIEDLRKYISTNLIYTGQKDPITGWSYEHSLWKRKPDGTLQLVVSKVVEPSNANYDGSSLATLLTNSDIITEDWNFGGGSEMFRLLKYDKKTITLRDAGFPIAGTHSGRHWIFAKDNKIYRVWIEYFATPNPYRYSPHIQVLDSEYNVLEDFATQMPYGLYGWTGFSVAMNRDYIYVATDYVINSPLSGGTLIAYVHLKNHSVGLFKNTGMNAGSITVDNNYIYKTDVGASPYYLTLQIYNIQTKALVSEVPIHDIVGDWGWSTHAMAVDANNIYISFYYPASPYYFTATVNKQTLLVSFEFTPYLKSASRMHITTDWETRMRQSPPEA